MKYLLKLLLLPLFVFAQEGALKSEFLSKKEKAIIPIAAYTANGDLDKLKIALAEGLNAGLSINEIKEALEHLYAYTGFPKNLNGIGLFMRVLDERKAAGIEDTKGKEASPLPQDFDRDAFGGKIRAMLAGLDEDIQGAPWQLFSPAIDKYLKEHLFADIFARDILDYKTRELVTISALAAMSGTEGQLKFHYGASLNVGLSKEQLHEFVQVLHVKLEQKRAKSAALVLEKVLKSKS